MRCLSGFPPTFGMHDPRAKADALRERRGTIGPTHRSYKFTVVLSSSVPVSTAERMAEIADARDQSVSSLIAEAIERWMASEGKRGVA